ncbi:hypothetical protein BXZ70DRAFT_1045453 [Cristinia sonorae]|uniref:DUF6534 domain-containing protein n=1 Tax=Cristinia sonorae TaxID=1940300 RepID=A0A8K0XL31_9AGAR|nr:hypothetical protein BXZ70DRAFT_1045453 [Cristinia sonorae]
MPNNVNETTTALPDITLIAGPVLIGHVITWGLMGMLTVQVYIYYLAFPKDNWKTKFLVGTAYAVETTQTACFTYDIFRIFVRGWSNPSELDSVGLLWLDISIIPGIVPTLCQLFYAWRIHRLSQSYKIPVLVALLSITQLVVTLYGGVRAIHMQNILNYPETVVFTSLLICFTSEALCDTLIACSMSYFFWKARKTVLSRQASTMLTRLIRLTVETGFITAVSTTVMFMLFVGQKDTLLYAGFLTPSSKLYSNTLLVLLNSRVRILGGRVEGGNAAVGGQLSIRTSFRRTLIFDHEANDTIPPSELPKGPDVKDETIDIDMTDSNGLQQLPFMPESRV